MNQNLSGSKKNKSTIKIVHMSCCTKFDVAKATGFQMSQPCTQNIEFYSDLWPAWPLWFVSATQLKPDEGTPELPDGRVRVRLDSDGSIHDVSQYEIEKVNYSTLLTRGVTVLKHDGSVRTSV